MDTTQTQSPAEAPVTANPPSVAPPVPSATPIDPSILAGDVMAAGGASTPQPPPSFSEPPATPPGEVDASGVRFDPAVHRTDEEGKPSRNANGNFYSKTVGRPPKPENLTAKQIRDRERYQREKRERMGQPDSAPNPSGQPVTPPTFADGTGGAVPLAPAGPDKFDAMAETFLNIGEGAILVPIFTEGIKASPQEHEMMKSTLAPALRSSNISDMPPWLAFTMVSCAVYAPKFTKPTVKERCLLLWLKLRGKKVTVLPEPKPVAEVKKEASPNLNQNRPPEKEPEPAKKIEPAMSNDPFQNTGEEIIQ